MTSTDVRGEEAGRELDAEIAEKVMGCNVFRSRGNEEIPADVFCHCDGTAHMYSWFDRDCSITPPMLAFYSTDIAAAWLVVEKAIDRGLDVRVEADWTAADVAYHCHIYDSRSGDIEADAWEATAPLAICRAALLAMSASTTPEEE